MRLELYAMQCGQSKVRNQSQVLPDSSRYLIFFFFFIRQPFPLRSFTLRMLRPFSRPSLSFSPVPHEPPLYFLPSLFFLMATVSNQKVSCVVNGNIVERRDRGGPSVPYLCARSYGKNTREASSPATKNDSQNEEEKRLFRTRGRKALTRLRSRKGPLPFF